ncbi:MAG: amidohydrolase family protein [Rhodospirillales bacterium]|nr:amidohydrolase family protein [Rhodospirillales bacterium]
MIIDMHCHYVPEPVAEILRNRTSAPFVEKLADGTEQRHMPAGNILSFADDYTDMADLRINHMDEMGIDIEVLSMGLLFGLHALPIEEAVAVATAFNDDLSALCKGHPHRFRGLALLPMADIGAAAREYRRARLELGLIGAILPVNSFVSREEADKTAAIFEAAQETGGHIFVHPGLRADELAAIGNKKKNKPADPNSTERMALKVQHNLALAMVTFSFSDFLDPYPDITVQLANLGGTLPMVLERMDHTVTSRMSERPLPSSQLGRIYLDCASLGPNAIDIAAKVYGPDKLLFGSDYPIFPIAQALDAVKNSSIDDDAKQKLLGGNAQTLIDRYQAG